jgi:cob(I)alamin adenosyltransferase
MPREKLVQRFTDAVKLRRSGHIHREIVHDLKNCMGVVLLTVGSLQADPNKARDSRTIETLEKMIHKINSRVEELAKLVSEQGRPKKTGLSRTRVIGRQNYREQIR